MKETDFYFFYFSSATCNIENSGLAIETDIAHELSIHEFPSVQIVGPADGNCQSVSNKYDATFSNFIFNHFFESPDPARVDCIHFSGKISSIRMNVLKDIVEESFAILRVMAGQRKATQCYEMVARMNSSMYFFIFYVCA